MTPLVSGSVEFVLLPLTMVWAVSLFGIGDSDALIYVLFSPFIFLPLFGIFMCVQQYRLEHM